MLHEKPAVMGRTIVQSSEHYLVVPWETWKESLPKLKASKKKGYNRGKKKLLFSVFPGGREQRRGKKRQQLSLAKGEDSSLPKES